MVDENPFDVTALELKDFGPDLALDKLTRFEIELKKHIHARDILVATPNLFDSAQNTLHALLSKGLNEPKLSDIYKKLKAIMEKLTDGFAIIDEFDQTTAANKTTNVCGKTPDLFSRAYPPTNRCDGKNGLILLNLKLKGVMS